MAGTGALLMALLVLSPTVFSLPLPEERDTEESRKVLGSSVVTSVSVVLDNANGTATAHFADAAGRPVGRPLGGDDIGSPVGLLTPDRYQFFTFDADGNLVKRYMTKDEVRSIIANGQKKGEAPTFYHNAPTGEGVDAAELVVGHTDEHDEQLASQLKMHHVVESVQNVLKSQLASEPASEDVPVMANDLPGAPDPGASWSMILPSYLGNVGENHESPLESAHSETASIESLMIGDAPVASTETGSGEKEHEDATEADEKTEEPGSSEEQSTETSSTLEVPEQVTEQIREQVKESEQVSEQAHEEEQEQATEEVQDQEHEKTTEQVHDEEQEQLTEEIKEQNNEQTTEQAQQEEQEQVTEEVQDQEHEKTTEQVHDEEQEQVTEEIKEQNNEQVAEQVQEQEYEQTTELATEIASLLLEDEPEDVSESTEDQEETTTLQIELNAKQKFPDTADVAAPITVPSDDEVAETTHMSKPSSSTTEKASITLPSSANPVKLSTSTSAELLTPLAGSDEMHADAPVKSSSEEESSESTDTKKQAENKEASTETSEEIHEDTTSVSELATEVEATTDILQKVELLQPADAEVEVLMEVAKEKESLSSLVEVSKVKESIESVPNAGDLSASVATSEDKSVNNMVDTTSTSSSEVRHPSFVVHDTKQSVEETRPDAGASEAVSFEEVTVQEDGTMEADDAESTDPSVSTALSSSVEEALTNGTLMDLNVTQTLGDALSTVLRQVAEDALADADADADANADADADSDANVVVTSVSSSHSSHSTSTSVSSSKEAEASAALATSDESVQRVEVLSPAEGDDKDKVKRHNKPVEVDEDVSVVRIALIQPGDSDVSKDSEDAATVRPSSTREPTSDEYIPISVEGPASEEVKEPEVEDVTSKAGSGDGETEGSGDDNEGSGDEDKEGSGGVDNVGALPAMFNVMEYTESDADFGVTPPHDTLFPRDSPLGTGPNTADYDNSKSTEFDVHKYVAGDKNVRLTTPASMQSSSSEENSSLYDVNKYANSDTDLGVTTPSHDADELNDASESEKKSTTTEQSGENSSMYDVNKYANSDTDLGVTTPSHDAEVEELNDEGDNLSAENIFDVNNYVTSDKDLGVTKSSSTEDSVDHSSDLYDVNKYVNSDNDLGITTPLSEAVTELTPSTSQGTVKSEEITTASTEGSAEGSTTLSDSEMMLNDEPHDEDDDTNANYLFKSPLAGAAAPSWTPVAVIAPHETTPGLVDLRPAPGESLGLEASTANLFEDVHNFAALCNELAFRMWLSATSKGVSAARSLVMSPFAITSLLSMIFLGAKGPTSGQMNDILRLDDMMTFNPHQVFRNVTESLLMEKLSGVATAAFVRQLYSDKNKGRMLDFYKQRASGFYDGHVEEVDFATIGDTVRRRTNMLVKKQTDGKIAEYMRGSNLELQPPLAAFGANVFQTDCSNASSAGRDGEMYFTVLPATRHRRLVPVPAVVYRSGFLAGYEPSLDATVVSLGGGDADVSTLLVLPGQQGQLAPGDGLPLLEARLFAAPFADAAWSKLLRSLLPRAGLEVQLPRFSHRSQLNMTRSLQNMGLNDLFDPQNADLKGLSGSSGDLHVSDIVQINTFSTCAEAGVGSQHHVEIYPGTPQRAGRDGSDAVSGDQEDLENVPLALRPRQARIDLSQETDAFEESVYQMPLALRPRQAREPEEDNSPRLKFDRPFLYFVRHNPTGFILHMGRFNPRLLN